MGAGHLLIVIHQSLLLRRLDDGLYFIRIVFIHRDHSSHSILLCKFFSNNVIHFACRAFCLRQFSVKLFSQNLREPLINSSARLLCISDLYASKLVAALFLCRRIAQTHLISVSLTTFLFTNREKSYMFMVDISMSCNTAFIALS